jgi:hypothetical protein
MGLKQEFKETIKAFLKWVMKDDSNRPYPEDSPVAIGSMNMNMTKSSSHGVGIGELNRGMNFVVFNATGGKVIQIHSYDPRTDRTNSNLYIITDKEDLGEELAQIITKESLSR